MISDSQILKATEALRAGRYSEVVELFESDLFDKDFPAAALYLLGFSLFKIGRFRESARCWENLAAQAWPLGTATKINVNFWSTAYMAARSEAQASRFEDAARFLEIYCAGYRGFRDSGKGQKLFADLARLSGMAEALSGIEAAKCLAEAGEWSQAADRLVEVRTRI